MPIRILKYTHEIHDYQLLKCEHTHDTFIAHISKDKNAFRCTACDGHKVTATPVGERLIKALPTGIKQTRFNVKMHRLRCHDCGMYLMENISFIASQQRRVSTSLERTVIDLRNHMSIKAIAGHYDLHWDTVKNIEKSHLKEKYKTIAMADVKAIGIDEVFMGKTIGEKGYLTIVRDLHSGAVLHVGQGKKGSALDGFAEKVKESKATIEIVAADLAQSFTSWVHQNLRSATIVYDHFHLIKLMNDKLAAIRRRTMNELEEYDKKELKNRRWHYAINRENLNPKATIELERCNSIFKELGTAYSLKESLRNIYSMADTKGFAKLAFERWCELADASRIPELKTMAKTIREHLAGITAYWSTGCMTSASMEGFNNKIGWLTRQAYGYRDEEYLIMKIYDLPNLKIANEL
ncbi:MAG: ISL3 family transposase [Deltaproteobacteria bacterium]|nr:ISL3 family transposase [Deltaproteobacteria bacterium]